MAYNKIIYNGDVLLDLTSDTATASKVANGETFHTSDGAIATGTAQLIYNSATEELTMPDWSVVIE